MENEEPWLSISLSGSSNIWEKEPFPFVLQCSSSSTKIEQARKLRYEYTGEKKNVVIVIYGTLLINQNDLLSSNPWISFVASDFKHQIKYRIYE